MHILETIYDWATEASSDTHTFWLEGLAGTGKSTISRTVADVLHQQKQLAGSFFFKRGEGSRAHGKQFFVTIACQLAARFPSMLSHVAAVLNKVPDIASKNIEKQFEALLEEPLGLGEGETRSNDLIIVIDALDECEPLDLSMILPRLAKTRLKCFITSRPDYNSLYTSSQLEGMQHIHLHKLDESITKQDIRTYLTSRLTEVKKKHLFARRNKIPPHWPDDDTLEGLTDLANPLFIAAATIWRMLDARNVPKSPVRIAQDILEKKSKGLKGIESIYTQVLAKLNPEFSSEFQKVVGPVIVMFDHLTISDLARLLGMDEDDIDCCITQLEEVLDVSNPEAPIRPFHLSLPDFLLGTSPPEGFRISEKDTHKDLADHCIRILHNTLRQDICNVGSPGCSRGEVSGELIKESLLSEVQYACLYWVDHLKACGEPIQDDDKTHRLLHATFPMWLEALSWIDKLDESRRMIYDLQQLTHVRPWPKPASRVSFDCY